MERYAILPEDLGVRRWQRSEIAGGDADRNATILRDVFSGQKGAPRDAVLANAAAALVAAEAAPTLKEGVRLAAEAVDRGGARDKLERLRALSHAP